MADCANDSRLEFDPMATSLWSQLQSLWREIGLGNRDWGIPPYIGVMFSSDPAVSKVGGGSTATLHPGPGQALGGETVKLRASISCRLCGGSFGGLPFDVSGQVQ